MKNRSLNMLIVAMVILAAFSVAIAMFLYDAHEEFDDRIEVSENGVTQQTMKMRNLKLVPTESKEYFVDFYCAASGTYEFDVQYEETADGGMKNFVNVAVTFDDEVIYRGTLAELLDADTVIEFDGYLNDDEPVRVLFSYEMPYETGNEAQGTWSDFNINFEIKKK